MGLLSELLYEDEKVAGTVAGTVATPAAEIRSASVVAIPMVAARVMPATVEGVTEIAVIDQPTSAPASAPTTAACPCPTCNSHLAWESIYRDGVLRCDQCEPSPSPAMIGGWWGLVSDCDGVGGFDASHFAWVPVTFEDAERRAAIAKDRYGNHTHGNASHSSRVASTAPSPTFDPTDAALASLAATEGEDGGGGTSAVPLTHHHRWSAPDAFGWCWGVDGDGTLHMRRRQFVESGVAAMGEGLAWLGETEEEWRARMRAVDEVWRERGG